MLEVGLTEKHKLLGPENVSMVSANTEVGVLMLHVRSRKRK